MVSASVEVCRGTCMAASGEHATSSGGATRSNYRPLNRCDWCRTAILATSHDEGRADLIAHPGHDNGGGTALASRAVSRRCEAGWSQPSARPEDGGPYWKVNRRRQAARSCKALHPDSHPAQDKFSATTTARERRVVAKHGRTTSRSRPGRRPLECRWQLEPNLMP